MCVGQPVSVELRHSLSRWCPFDRDNVISMTGASTFWMEDDKFRCQIDGVRRIDGVHFMLKKY